MNPLASIFVGIGVLLSCSNPPQLSHFVSSDTNQNRPSSDAHFGSGLFSGDNQLLKIPDSIYSGTGTLDHRGGSAGTQIDLVVGLDSEKIQMSIKAIRAVSGDYIDKVNQSLAPSVGDRVSQRTKKEDIRQLEGSEFLVFMNSTTTHLGQKLSYRTPMPILVIPGNKTRYEILREKDLVFESQVEGWRTFNMRTTISLESESEDKIKVNMQTDIPADTDGSYYEVSVLPRSVSFAIDTKSRKIEKIDYANYYRDSKRKRRYEYRGTLSVQE